MPETAEEKKKREEEEAKAEAQAQEDLGSDTKIQEDKFEFKNPALKGKSPQELEALFDMSQQLVTGQNKKLSSLEGKVRDLELKPAAPAVPETKEDFFTNPDAAMKRLEDRLVAQIAPLQAQITDARSDLAAQGLEERMAAEFDDWHEIRPWIDQLIAKQNFPNPNDEGLLKTLYYTAVGLRQKQGITSTPTPKKEVTEVPGSDVHRGPIPQHRSSPPPPPPAKPADAGGVTWDDLDETEKVLCKASKMTPSIFKELQELNAEDVAESTVGLEKKEA